MIFIGMFRPRSVGNIPSVSLQLFCLSFAAWADVLGSSYRYVLNDFCEGIIYLEHCSYFS